MAVPLRWEASGEPPSRLRPRPLERRSHPEPPEGARSSLSPPLGVSVFGCFEFAVLANRLRTADPSEVARCLRLIESVADALRQMDDGDCVKCLVKLWL